MKKDFDSNQAREFLQERELREREARELERTAIFTTAVDTLKDIFRNKNVEVYLVGSITQPHMFYPNSDIDIVLKNFHGDRFDLWAQLENMLKRKIEIILFERCHFQDHIIKNGYKVI